MGAPFKPDHLIACDIETTGLDFDKDQILEVAAVVIESQTFVEVERFTSIILPVLPWTPGDSAALDPRVREMHEASGLLTALERGEGAPRSEVFDTLGALFARYPQQLLIGRNVEKFDRPFLERKSPRLTEVLHYRCLNLSSFTTFCALYKPAARARLDAERKPDAHRALDDCLGDIRLLRLLVDAL